MAPEDNLRIKLIEHLSKEIETHTNNLMTFRARINLPIFVGPFLLLGALVLRDKSLPRGIDFNWLTSLCIIGLIMCYFTMGMACRTIEAQMWRKCNEWRELILRLTEDSNAKVSAQQIKFKHRLTYGYVVVYLAMSLAFFFALLLTVGLNLIGSQPTG